MKKTVLSLAFIALFALTAQAGMKEFASMKVDVPDGWTTMEQGPIVLVMAPDQQSVLTAAVAPAGDQTAESIAKNTSEGLKGSTPVAEGDGYYFTFAAEGQQGAMLIRVINKQAIVTTLMGKDGNLLPMAKSIELK